MTQENTNQNQNTGAGGSIGDSALFEVNKEFKEKATMEKAKSLGLSYVNIEKTPINPDLLYLLTPETAEKAMLMPFFKVGQKLRVAVVNPDSPATQQALNDFRAKGYQLNINLATEESIRAAMKLYQSPQYKMKKELVTKVEEKELQTYEKEVEQLAALKEKIEKASSEEALNLIDVGAVKSGASDVHYEPEENHVRIRFRIDGILHKIFDLEKGVYNNIVNQIKYKAKMKLNITNVPQDGRYHFILNERKIDVRVSALPTEYGETIVCRFLDSKQKFLEFENMGFFGRNLELINHACRITYGMILVTGPTGSGKTTTLYALLSNFSKPETKVITLEDPIEYHLPGISQSQINEKRDYSFASGLKSILRQDPDIVMIGEIRDLITAEVAAQAALTGHVLLSTLHTNNVIETLPRLVNMGLPEFMIAPALNTIIAQRLVRVLCPDCQEEKPVPESERIEYEKILAGIKKIDPSTNASVPEKLHYPKGCEKCSNTGYKGRINIIEMLTMDAELKDAILEKAPSSKILELARGKGMLTMEEDGVLKALKGMTTLEEVHRVMRS